MVGSRGILPLLPLSAIGPPPVGIPKELAKCRERVGIVGVRWLQASDGETVSLLNAEQPDLLPNFDLLGVDLAWHPDSRSFHGGPAGLLLRQCAEGKEHLGILLVEGSVPIDDQAAPSYHGQRIAEQVLRLAAARYVMAADTCASYGRVKCWGRDGRRSTGLPFTR